MIFLPVLLLLGAGAVFVYIRSRPSVEKSRTKALWFFDAITISLFGLLCLVGFAYFSYALLTPFLWALLIFLPASILRNLFFRTRKPSR